MNVACTACPAKYSVPDEKVRGKKVKITCKHCGTAIVVDGTALGPGPAQKDALTSLGPVLPDSKLPAADAPLIVPPKEPSAPAAAGAEITWMVGYPDDRQEQHTTSEIVSLYKSGKMDDECFVWRDGMDDWLPPFDVPEVAEALTKAGLSKRGAPLPLNDEEDEATRVAPSPFDMEAPEPPAPFVTSAAAVPAASPAPAAKLEPKPVEKPAPEPKPVVAPKPAEAPRAAAAAIKPAAARRNAPQRGAVDLFGAVDSAGSEGSESDDIAPMLGGGGMGGGASDDAAQKLTGARNESSVLFSLDALAKVEKPKPKDKKRDDSAAAAELFGDSSPNSLMNVGGGGLGILAAPDFTKPAAPAPEPVRAISDVQLTAPGPAKSGGSMWVGVGIGVGIALLAGGAFLFLNKKPDADATAPTPSASAAAATKPEPTSEPTAAPSTPSSAAAPAETSSAAAPEASATAAVAGKPAAPGTPTTGTAAAAVAAKPGGDAKKPDAPAAPAGGGEFDRSAAVSSLGAAAANAASCRKAEGPFGTGKASVTFAPSGRATQANITGAFAGTEVGGCVARIFRAAKVPPFAGDPVTVSKSFTIE